MGDDTHFHGILEFSRPMTAEELAWIEQVREAGHNWTPEISAAVTAMNTVPGHATIISVPEGADLAAKMRGFIVGKELSAGYAADMRVYDDQRGLVYGAEKTYDMIGGLNFLIVNVRTKIPDFRLTGMLAAYTDFEPYYWYVKIDDNGMAYSETITSREFFDFRRKLYPNGYRGYGPVDPLEYPELFKRKPDYESEPVYDNEHDWEEEPSRVMRAFRRIRDWLRPT